jgi:AcrR family transcriptional regulator
MSNPGELFPKGARKGAGVVGLDYGTARDQSLAELCRGDRPAAAGQRGDAGGIETAFDDGRLAIDARQCGSIGSDGCRDPLQQLIDEIRRSRTILGYFLPPSWSRQNSLSIMKAVSAPMSTGEIAKPADAPATARERLLAVAYELFSRRGIRAVGVDTIIAQAGVAKMTLYRYFPSKHDLVLAFLQRREQLWTHQWLEDEVKRRASAPDERLLTIFDVFHEWFQRDDFEGCSFINVLLETFDQADPARAATTIHLANIRVFLRGLAEEIGVAEPEDFSRKWHILMKGSIVAAGEGDRLAARRARELGELLLVSERRGT